MRNPVRCLIACLMMVTGLTVATQGVAHATITTVCGINANVYYNIVRVVNNGHKQIRVVPQCSAGSTSTGVMINASAGNANTFKPFPGYPQEGFQFELAAHPISGSWSQYGQPIFTADGGIFSGGELSTACAYYCINEPAGETHYTLEIAAIQNNAVYYISRYDLYTNDSVDTAIHVGNQDAAGIYYNVSGDGATVGNSYPGTVGHETLTAGWSFYGCSTAWSRSNGASISQPSMAQAPSSPADSPWFPSLAGTVACGTAKTTVVSSVAGEIEAACVDQNSNATGTGTWYVRDCEHWLPGQAIYLGNYAGSWQGDWSSSATGGYFSTVDSNAGGTHHPAFKLRVRVLYRDASTGTLHWVASA